MTADSERIERWKNYATIFSGSPRPPAQPSRHFCEPMLRELEELAGPGGYESYQELVDETVRNVGVKGKFTVVVNLLSPAARFPDNGRSIAEAVIEGWQAALTAKQHEAIGMSVSEDGTTARRAYVKILAREVENVLSHWKMSRLEARHSVQFNVAAAKDVTPVEWAKLTRADLDRISKSIEAAKVCRAQAELLNTKPGEGGSLRQVNEMLRRMANQELDNHDVADIATLVQEFVKAGYQLVMKGSEGQPLTLTSQMRSDRGRRRFVIRHAGDQQTEVTSPNKLPTGLKMIREK